MPSASPSLSPSPSPPSPRSPPPSPCSCSSFGSCSQAPRSLMLSCSLPLMLELSGARWSSKRPMITITNARAAFGKHRNSPDVTPSNCAWIQPCFFPNVLLDSSQAESSNYFDGGSREIFATRVGRIRPVPIVRRPQWAFHRSYLERVRPSQGGTTPERRPERHLQLRSRSAVLRDDDFCRCLGYNEECLCGGIMLARPQRFRDGRYNVDEAVLRAW